jgi:hypothetical protein
METASEPMTLFFKSLKYGHFRSSVPKSLGQQALRRIRSLERISAIWPITRSTTPSSNHRRAWLFPARQLGQRIVRNWEVGGPKATTEKLQNGISTTRVQFPGGSRILPFAARLIRHRPHGYRNAC